MRISLPERFKVRHVIVFATALFLAQIMEGTDLTFALLFFVYLCLFATAFNSAKGLFFPSGAWILFTGLLTCIVGLVYKILINEPGESNLKEPLVTMGAYAAGMGGMALAAYITANYRPKKALLADLGLGSTMKQASLGCLVFGILIILLAGNSNHETATLVSAAAQLNHFPQMAILLSTVYEINRSDGKRSTNWIVWTAGIILFLFGVIGFSKEGMFISFTVWMIPCIILGYDFKKVQLLVLGAFMAFMVYYMVPYSQYGRKDRSEDVEATVAASWEYLHELPTVRRLYLESADVANVSNGPHLYNGAEGLMDRLQMLAFDDTLINYTDSGNYSGLAPTYTAFFNAIPRFLWPSKPVYGAGNEYGRQIGVIADDDTSTGISFSPTGDAYHQVGWYGPIVVEPLVFMFLFFVMDALAGDVRKAPWGLLFIALSVHLAPEGLLAGAVYMATFGAEAVIFAAVLSAMLFPRLLALATGGSRTRVRASRTFRPSAEALRIRAAMRASTPDPAPPAR